MIIPILGTCVQYPGLRSGDALGDASTPALREKPESKTGILLSRTMPVS